MDGRQLNRYVGDYDKFMEVYEMKKAQLEAAYNKQQQEIADLLNVNKMTYLHFFIKKIFKLFLKKY